MRFLLWLVVFLLFGASLAFAGVAGIYAYYARELPNLSQLERRPLFQTARILDRNGQVLEELVDPSGGRRTIVPLAEIPRSLQYATVAAEDASFYENPGFDPRAIVRALYQNFSGRRIVSGASTITQQLVKNTLLTPEVSAERKIKEAFLSIEMTRRYSKDRILEMYLNEIYYGNLAYGAEAAAQTYFSKPARDLTLGEAAFLAGLPQAPATYDPYTAFGAARERQTYVLDQMEQRDFATPEAVAAARQQPIQLRSREAGNIVKAPHFTLYVRQWLEQRFPTDLLFRAGLEVQTTLDLRLQEQAEQAARAAIEAIRERNARNAALVALRPESGEVLAMVGSLDFNDLTIDGQVNVAIQPRQPGSTLKPFTYLASFAKGWSPATMIMDLPTTFGGSYRPNNFDGKFRGPVRARQALAQSLNIPAVKTLEFVGLEEMIGLVHRFGINGLREPQRYGLSVTLGGGEVTLVDLVYAYQVLANGGQQVGAPVADESRRPGYRDYEPLVVLKVTDSTGRVLYERPPGAGQALVDPNLAYLITHILSDDEARAPTFGRNSALALNRPAAVKTGTTDDFRDSWVVGYTPDLLTGVWVGNNDNSPMRDVLGAQGAGRIWHGFMESALAETPPRDFVRPPGVVEKEVCALSGLLPTPNCPERVRELFAPNTVPTKQDDFYRRVDVCLVNGKLASELTPPNARESRLFVVFPEPYQAWAVQNGYPSPPTERCDDVYRGVKRAEIVSPAPSTPIAGEVQVVGTALLDDLHHYDLEFGAGANPGAWNSITVGRQQGVDNALLGVWDTSGLRPGTYALRLSLFDSVGNRHEGRAVAVVGSQTTSTPLPSPPPLAPPRATPGPAVAPTSGARGQPTPAGPVPKQTAPVPTPTIPLPLRPPVQSPAVPPSGR